jgi:predicted nucleic acid-binding Zn finger protein
MLVVTTGLSQVGFQQGEDIINPRVCTCPFFIFLFFLNFQGKSHTQGIFLNFL